MKEKKDRSSRKALFGLFLIIIGALWILFKLNFIPIVLTDILISWQMLLIGIGVFSMISGNRTSGIILIVIGSFFLIDELLIIPYHLRQFGWPVLIIGVGVVLIITHKMKSKTPRIESSMQGADFFDDFIIFGGKEVFVRTNNFLGGKITSIFGGAEFDLRQTSLADNGATIECVNIFGGSGFKVPADWTVINEVNVIFGAFTDKRGTSVLNANQDASKVLVIKGFCAFGGVEVKYN